MADADRIAAALRYQQEMDAAQRPATMNPNIAAQGATGRALVAPPTSVMDERYPAWKKSQDDAENLINAADMIGAAIPLAGPAVKGAVALGRYAGPELARGLEQHMVRMGGIMPLDVYHGTPHRFPPTAKNPLGEFDASKIGTGEGAQVYGHGLYLAENPAVAKEYQRALSDNLVSAESAAKSYLDDAGGDISKAVVQMADHARGGFGYSATQMQNMRAGLDLLKRNADLSKAKVPGSFYKVDLPDEQIAKMLDWDKPLSQQAGIAPMLDALQTSSELPRGFGQAIAAARARPHFDGNDLFAELVKVMPNAQASEVMKRAGIPGIRYLDQGSRTGGGTSNFVVFDPKHMNILERDGVTAESLRKVAGQQMTEPTNYLSAESIVSPHGVRDTEKLLSLTKSMKDSGWQGRPILTYDVGRGEEALTGSHRIEAAKKANIEVPIYRIENAGDYVDKNGKSILDLGFMELNDQIKWLNKFGDKNAAKLLRQEPEF